MHKMLRLFGIGALSMLCTAAVFAQAKSEKSPWRNIDESTIPTNGTRYIQPTKYLTFSLDVETMKATLALVKRITDPDYTPVFIVLPKPDGMFSTYQVFENATMSEGLAAQFPEIRSYDGTATDGSGEVVKFDLTPQGFHAMTLIPGKKTTYIDPYSFGGGDITNYVVYSREDLVKTESFVCHLDEETLLTEEYKQDLDPVKSFGNCTQRTYRLALAATGEYTAFHGGTVALAQAAQVTTINRVNGVYMRDLAVTLTIIANNNLLIYTNSGTDPYTNGNPGSMINQNQTNITSVIGSANYDVGHVFGTNSGGLAGLGVVCSNSSKARGVTGSSAPVGDAFDIDYVAHELGHEFSGNHSFRGNAGSCSGNANGSTAMEPGSGSSIMAYAGICSPQNVQSNSDDYFHGVNMAEMHSFINGSGNGCAVSTAIPAQTSPTITSSTTSSLTIPANTPFALTAIATDPDGDVLTYCWEQMNSQNSTQPPVATATGGPNFRSFDPSLNGTRYFPSISSLMSGGPFTWEVLPSVNRTMNFRCTVRDNEVNGGCNDHVDLTISTTTSAGPFVLNYPSAANITWLQGSAQTVTWSVANTNLAPVSCANVDLLLSTDGGATFTIVADDVPNDGSEDIIVPNVASNNCIMMVQCANGTFFDISDNEFTITTTDDYTLDLPVAADSMCRFESLDLLVNVNNLGTDTNLVTLSVTGLPGSVVTSFNPNPVMPGSTSTLTIYSPGSSNASYNFSVNGTSASGNHSVSGTLLITTITANAMLNNSIFTASPANQIYQWLDCDANMAPISGETSQTFVPSENGNYAVMVTKNGCVDTSSCVAYNFVGMVENTVIDVSVFPNPTDGKLTVHFESLETANISVTDVTGRVIRFIPNCISGTNIDLSHDAKGVYFLNLSVGNQLRTVKITKE